jgi:hypothetical protein
VVLLSSVKFVVGKMSTTAKPKMVVQVTRKGGKVDKLPDRLRKELRRTIAMVLYEKVHEQDNMRMKDQESLMEKLFYGHGDSISYLEMFLKGQGVFEHMFEANSDNSGSKRLKQLFARSTKAFILGGNINQDVMERVQLSKTEIVTGRYLRSCAAEGACEARKAIPFLLKYLDEHTGQPLRSGDEIEDVVNRWLDDFYVYSESKTVTSPVKKASTSNENEDLASSDDEVDEGNRLVATGAPNTTTEASTLSNTLQEPPATPNKVSNDNGDVIITIPHRHNDYFFPGFMFVLLFGPFSENIEAKRTMDFFLNRDPTVLSSIEKKAYGRSRMRDQKQQHDIDFSTYEKPPKRQVLSIADELRIAGLECKQAALQMQNAQTSNQQFETRLMAKKIELDSIRSLMDAAGQMAKATNNWDVWQRLFQQYETCQNEMRAINEEHEAQRGSLLGDVKIPSLTALKRLPQEDECPVQEISTEQSSNTSQLSSPVTRTKPPRSLQLNKK